MGLREQGTPDSIRVWYFVNKRTTHKLQKQKVEVINIRDLIEMTYKCRFTPVTDCHKCKYYNECLLSEILDVLTGNAHQ